MSYYLNDWLIRRFMAAGARKKDLALAYHWSGEDSLVGGLWIDRISGLGWTATNNPVHNSDNYVCGKSVGYFVMNMNTLGLNLGRHWAVEADFEVVSLDNTLSVIDFGSLSNSTHAFAIASGSPWSTMTDNYKGFGNATTYATLATLGQALAVGTRKTCRIGCEAYDATQDTQYLEVDGVKTLGFAPHKPTTFYQNFNKAEAVIGAGWEARYAGGSIKIYDIKIYTES